MNKITPAKKLELLRQLIEKEAIAKKNNINKVTLEPTSPTSPKTNAGIYTQNVKKEMLKVAFVTLVCIVFILSAYLSELQYGLLTKYASELTSFLHL